MKQTLLCFFAGLIALLAACTNKEKDAAAAIAKELEVKEFTVADTAFYEHRKENKAVILFFKEPKLVSPELDPVYLSAKTALNFIDKVGKEQAPDAVIVKLLIKGYIYQKQFSYETLEGVQDYYKRAKDFIAALSNSDKVMAASLLKAESINPDDMMQVFLAFDDRTLQDGKLGDIKMLGFEESVATTSGRNVMAVRLSVYRQNTITEIYNFTFDKADKKIVGIGWDVVKKANEE